MYPGEFETLFSKISLIFTLESVAKQEKIEGKLLQRNPQTPLWDTLESIEEYDGIDIGGGRYVKTEHFFRKPMRILFFVLIHEIESRLYRIHRWNGDDLAGLDELNFNDLIKQLVDCEDLVSYQKVYSSRSEFKEDLKAISSFRNMIVHTNRKLLKCVDAAFLVNRKRQILDVLRALQQILDKAAHSREK